jgi:hypothetical protein
MIFLYNENPDRNSFQNKMLKTERHNKLLPIDVAQTLLSLKLCCRSNFAVAQTWGHRHFLSANKLQINSHRLKA